MNYLALNLSPAVPIYDISVSPFLRSVVILLNKGRITYVTSSQLAWLFSYVTTIISVV